MSVAEINLLNFLQKYRQTVIIVILFSSPNGLYEIYVSCGIMYGIIRVESDKAWTLREELKQVLEADYKQNGEPSGEFINTFAEKYNLEVEI